VQSRAVEWENGRTRQAAVASVGNISILLLPRLERECCVDHHQLRQGWGDSRQATARWSAAMGGNLKGKPIEFWTIVTVCYASSARVVAHGIAALRRIVRDS
jgi:hypothetical protein